MNEGKVSPVLWPVAPFLLASVGAFAAHFQKRIGGERTGKNEKESRTILLKYVTRAYIVYVRVVS